MWGRVFGKHGEAGKRVPFVFVEVALLTPSWSLDSQPPSSFFLLLSSASRDGGDGQRGTVRKCPPRDLPCLASLCQVAPTSLSNGKETRNALVTQTSEIFLVRG